MTLAERFGRNEIVVKQIDGTLAVLDLTSPSPCDHRALLGEMVVAGHESTCLGFAAKLNTISEEHLGATFVLPEDAVSFCVSNLGAAVLRALQDNEPMSSPWEEVFRSQAQRLSNNCYWQQLTEWAFGGECG